MLLRTNDPFVTKTDLNLRKIETQNYWNILNTKMSIVVGNAEVCGKLRIHPRDIVVGNAEGCERILVHPRDIKETQAGWNDGVQK